MTTILVCPDCRCIDIDTIIDCVNNLNEYVCKKCDWVSNSPDPFLYDTEKKNWVSKDSDTQHLMLVGKTFYLYVHGEKSSDEDEIYEQGFPRPIAHQLRESAYEHKITYEIIWDVENMRLDAIPIMLDDVKLLREKEE